ncbi:CsgG/HfaB family protein [bacterium]|nr:CsgG/HfaB family protein [bacterium]
MGFQKNYRVIDRENLDRILDEQKMQMTGLVNSDFAVEAGQLTGAQQVVISQCYCNNEDAVYSIKIIDCSTAEVSSSALFSLGSPLELGERTGEIFSPE